MPEDPKVLRIRLSLKGRPIQSYAFQQDVITIGRDPEADIFLDNPGVSREHVRIERFPDGSYAVKDLGSANGTFLNDEPVQSAMIYSSDVIRVGKFSLWVALESERPGAESPVETPRARPGFAAETMMLSTQELDHVMKGSAGRERSDAARHVPPPARSAAPVAPRERVSPVAAAPVAMTAQSSDAGRPKLALGPLGIGLVVILATSLGAGFAWLILR